MRTLYDVLEIDPCANQAAVEAAFQERLREYQPNRLAELGEASRQLAEQEREWVQYAYEVLRDPEARSVYDAELATQTATTGTMGVSQHLDDIFASPQNDDALAGSSFWRALYYLSIAVAVVGGFVAAWAKYN